MKPDIVFFGERLPSRFFELLQSDFPQCDLLLVMGTSLAVQPFASLIGQVASETPRVLINRERVGEQPMPIRGPSGPFAFDAVPSRDFHLLGDCDDGVRYLAAAAGWAASWRRCAPPASAGSEAVGEVRAAACGGRRRSPGVNMLADGSAGAQRSASLGAEAVPAGGRAGGGTW